ncbi:hypothetical protein H7R39_06455 [Campylobacter sp. Marseille-Q3452]|uniref:Uncharacterized protein n=1 Tax=Campylobacter massiliensis TaxID=2762557 RepID=A0A842JA88_9BACT|nr:hypothetical protein [Campylobacter massiliensis]MBC2882899.1 hypothetical protein [Campylobacter massiliensis]
MRVKDSELSGHLAFAPYSALNFTRRDGNAEFANSDDAVKFTEFEVKGEHIGKSAQKTKA